MDKYFTIFYFINAWPLPKFFPYTMASYYSLAGYSWF